MSVSNEQIYAVLLDMKQDLGSVKAQTAMQGAALAAHATRVEALATRIDIVTSRQATDSGSDSTWRRVINAGVGLAGAGLGALATIITRAHR